MKNKYRNNLKLGAFIATGLLLFILGIYYLGKMQNMFESKIKVYAEFNDVKGLQAGSGIHFMGINVGTVQDISIHNDSIVRVEMGLDQEVRSFIQKDAKVEIENEGLMGSKMIVIHSGSGLADDIDEMDILPSFSSISYEDILDELETASSFTSQAARNLLEVTTKINEGTGDIARLINDDLLSRKIQSFSKELSILTLQAEGILQKANSGENDFAMLLNDDKLTSKLAGTLENIDSTSENLKIASFDFLDATQQMKHGGGVLQKLLYDTVFSKEIDTAVYRVNDGVLTVVETADAIKESWIINLFSGKKD